jgi:hypothetical protein
MYGRDSRTAAGRWASKERPEVDTDKQTNRHGRGVSRQTVGVVSNLAVEMLLVNPREHVALGRL